MIVRKILLKAIYIHLTLVFSRWNISCERQRNVVVEAKTVWNKHAHHIFSRLSLDCKRNVIPDCVNDNRDMSRDLKYQSKAIYKQNNRFIKNPLSNVQHARRRNNHDENLHKTILGVDTPETSSQSHAMMVSLEKETKDQYPQPPSSISAMNESLWPPWPFNLLTKRKVTFPSSPTNRTGETNDQSDAQIMFNYLQEKAKVGVQQMQLMTSALSFHLPPAAPPIILLAIQPPTNTASSKIQLPAQFSNVIAKRLSLFSLGISAMCWADYELRRKKRLTPIPLFLNDSPNAKDIRRFVLPPFLPEEVPPIELDPVLGNTFNDADESNINEAAVVEKLEDDEVIPDIFDSNGNANINIPRLRRSVNKMYKAATPKPERISRTINRWQKMMRIKQRDELELKRRQTMEQLLLLQKLKKEDLKKMGLLQQSMNLNGIKGIGQGIFNGDLGASNSTSSPLGYALVTGASRGIGRALAVELARWDIPLILVARDKDKLMAVAKEVKTAYGVRCCVIPADLSEVDTAKQIHKATVDAGLRVDLLINNAGVYNIGDFVDSKEQEFRKMMNVNIGSVTDLSYLYGKDMKRQRRGRILFVSSVAGAVPGGPGVATYAATKAYEKSLAQSIGSELEKYGVGVTCLMPGAVKGTSFATGSTGEAVCWKLPFYPMQSDDIAQRGIRALLSGEAEVIPGWHNRLFLKIFSPLIPQRLVSSVVGFAFSPLKLGVPTPPWMQVKSDSDSLAVMNMLPLNKASAKSPPLVLRLPKLEQVSKLPVEVPMQEEDEKEIAGEKIREESGGTESKPDMHTQFDTSDGMKGDDEAGEIPTDTSIKDTKELGELDVLENKSNKNVQSDTSDVMNKDEEVGKIFTDTSTKDMNELD